VGGTKDIKDVKDLKGEVDDERAEGTG